MRYLKMLGLLTVAAVLSMAFAGPASATVATAPAGTTYTGTFHMVSAGHTIMHNSFTTIECNQTVHGTVSGHGPSVTVGMQIMQWTYTNCTGSNTATSPLASPGTLEVHALTNGNGTVTSSGTALTFTNHAFGGTCIYTTSATDIGTLTAAPSNEGHATLDINATIPRTGGSLGVFCGSTGNWTGSFKFNTPTGLRFS